MLQWTTDHIVEAQAKKFGIELTETTFDFSSIDWDTSRHNGARLSKPIDDDLVSEYAMAMERGDIFPKPVILQAKQHGIILGGNQRCLAAKSIGQTKCQCYLFKTDDAMVIDLFPRILNRFNGPRLNRDEAILQAVHAIDTFGYDHQKAEELFILAKGTLSKYIRNRDTKDALVRRGINCAKFNSNHLRALSGLHNENAQTEFARVLENSDITGEQSGEYLKEIKKHRTESGQLQTINELRQKLHVTDAAPVVSIPRNLRSKFIGWITTGENYLDKKTKLAQLQITEISEADEIAERLENLRNKMGVLLSSARGKKIQTRTRSRSA